eukprot:3461565-Rhodomonas_salina.1
MPPTICPHHAHPKSKSTIQGSHSTLKQVLFEIRTVLTGRCVYPGGGCTATNAGGADADESRADADHHRGNQTVPLQCQERPAQER